MDTANTVKVFGHFMKCAALITFIFQSCGFLESNSIKDEYLLFDNFKIISNKEDSGSGLQLVLEYSANSLDVLQDKCYEIYFSNTEIYVKYQMFGSKFGYSHIILVKQTAGTEKAKYKNKDIDEATYLLKTSQCKCKHLLLVSDTSNQSN